MNRWLILIASLLLTSACVEESFALVIELQTDMISGAEFVSVATRIEPYAGGASDSDSFSATRDIDFSTRRRVAFFDRLPPGRYIVTVDLVRVDGATAITRVVDIVLESNFAVTVVATRSCLNVLCDDGLTCLSGRCVDFRCTPSTPEFCPEPACAASAECPEPLAACAEAECVSGECFAVERADSMCSSNQFCQAETMCVDYPALPDGGVVDGGVADGGVLDAEAPDAMVLPDAPWPSRPVRGAHLGMLSQGAGPLVVNSTTNRPKFFWSRNSTATAFSIQVDDDPAFGSPEIEVLDTVMRTYETTASETLDPGKYYWRVAGCNGAGCSAFSDASYFWLGRVREDVDGSFDGIGAIVVGAPTSGRDDTPAMGTLHRGEVLTYQYSTSSSSFGTATGIAIIDANGDTESEFGTSLSVGNFDDTGPLELAAGAPKRGAQEGLVQVIQGDAEPTPQQLVGPDGPTADTQFGIVVRVPGDLDGDGFDELLVGQGSTSSRRGRVIVYWGSAAGLSETNTSVLVSPNLPGDRFGLSIGAIGDVNGDGFVDLAIGASDAMTSVGQVGRVYVYLGGPDGASGTTLADTRTMLEAPVAVDGEEFGFAIASADVDHDGYDDALIGAPGGTAPRSGGSVYVFFGSDDDSHLRLNPPRAIVSPVPSTAGRFGSVIAGGGDVDGDGLYDFVIAAPIHSRVGGGTGRVWLYRPTAASRMAPEFPPTPEELQPSSMNPNRAYGSCLALSVDRTGDGHADVIIGAPNGVNVDDPGLSDRGYVDVYFGTNVAGDFLSIGATIYGASSTGDYLYVSQFGRSCL